jgi:hypothetical protein
MKYIRPIKITDTDRLSGRSGCLCLLPKKTNQNEMQSGRNLLTYSNHHKKDIK